MHDKVYWVQFVAWQQDTVKILHWSLPVAYSARKELQVMAPGDSIAVAPGGCTTVAPGGCTTIVVRMQIMLRALVI